ncbi:MAG: hypothetical protein ACRDCE_20255 [Cetobacterium sp.]|uniref:hypothetical protein n=1 Tax=Cetobacterium sp. TaxID=2071632 RepID=UPI003EE4A0B4
MNAFGAGFGLFMVVVWVLGLCGWILNVCQIVIAALSGFELNLLMVIKIVGVFAPPLGGIMGIAGIF